MNTKMNAIRKYITLLVLGAAAGAIYILPYIKYTFYDQLMSVMNISDAQSGFLLSMYAIGCIVLYIPGGVLADKIQPKNSIIISLLFTTGLTILFAFTFNYIISLIIWFLLAFCTCFVFWAAVLKAVRVIGKPEEQGRMYGIYYAANGGASALIGGLCLKTYTATNGGDVRHGMFMACMLVAAFTLVLAILIFVLIPKQSKEQMEANVDKNKFKFSDITKVLKNKYVWILSAMFFCIYGVYSCSSYFTPYLTDVFGYSSEGSSALNLVRVYGAMLVVPPIAGVLADKVFKSTSKWFVICGSVLALTILSIILMGENGNPSLISFVSIAIGFLAMGLYGIMFSTMNEVKIPIEITGTAIGIASIIGYLPDLFLQTFFGNLIVDHGNTGYTYIFIILMVMALVPALGSAYIYKTQVKK